MPLRPLRSTFKALWFGIGLVLVLALQGAQAGDMARTVAELMESTKLHALTKTETAARRHVADGRHDTLEILLISDRLKGVSRVSEDGELILQYRESDVPAQELVRRAFILRALRKIEDQASAEGGLAGMGPWRFGMSRDEVRQQSLFGPYYSFQNADIGTEGGLFAGERRPLSFYFEKDRLDRMMLIVYLGKDPQLAQQAWAQCQAHLQSRFGGAEGDLAPALRRSSLFKGPAPALRMRASPMPPQREVLASAQRTDDGRVMVSLVYAQPRLPTVSRLPSSGGADRVAVYLLPADDFPEPLADALARQLGQETGLRVKASLRFPLGELQPFEGSNQFAAEDLMDRARPITRSLQDAGPRTYFVVLTARDINSRSRNFRFQYSLHNPMSKLSVLSIARMLDREDGVLSERSALRLYKMTKRTLGEMRLGWQRSSDPEDLMYAPIMGMDDLDRIGLEHRPAKAATAVP